MNLGSTGGADLRAFLAEKSQFFARTPGFRSLFDDLDLDEASRVERLWASLCALRVGDPASAEAHSEFLVRSMPDEDDGQGALAVRTFAESILARARQAGSAGGNLYLDARPPGAQLRAFELLRLRTPLIPFAYAAGNRALLDAMEAPGPVTIIDVGIGRGGQIRALLRNPSARRLFTSVRVVGVEPDSSSDTGTGALELAEHNVLRTAQEVGIPATFHGIASRAEDLELGQLEAAGLTGTVIANSAFSLHHVPATDDPEGGRARVLRLLRRARVRAFVLVEPDSNHYEDDVLLRFPHAYRHYRTVSRSLHQLLSPGDASLVWNEFFAPEVRNVISHEGSERTERHEESASWLLRLHAADWQPQRVDGLVPQAAAPSGFTVDSRSSAFSLTFRGVALLSVMRAVPV